MPSRLIHRAAVAALGLTLIVASYAVADTVEADSDTIATGLQSSRDLGEVGPGAVIPVPVSFELECGNFSHVDPGQSVIVETGLEVIPPGGAVAFDPVTVGPTPSTWATDGNPCPVPTPKVTAQGMITFTAPTDPGEHTYTFIFLNTLTPAGSEDGSALTNMTALDFTLTVVLNTPPSLVLPADATVEGNTQGGATAAYAVTATDAEDDPAPTPTCTPAPGSVLPLGPNTISCSVEDSGGLTDAGSFTITVVDTTAPTLVGVPGLIDATATGPDGAAVTYAAPAATDVVDPAPTVDCAPPSGSTLPVGTTTVTCTATDASGNTASASFSITVRPAADYRVIFREPVGTGGGLTTNGSRTIPVRVEIWRDDSLVTVGSPLLVVTDCSTREQLRSQPLTWHPDPLRWAAQLETAGLGTGCRRVAVVLEGADVGAFTLRLEPSSTGSLGVRRSGR